MHEGSPEPSGLDDLRRRLYQPGAAAEDVALYETARGGPREAPSIPAGSAPAKGRRVAVVVGAAVVGGAVVGALVAAFVSAGVGARPVSRPSASASPSASVASIVEDDVPAPFPARAAFVRALGSGGRAGVLAYLSAHPDLLPPQLRTVQRAASSEYAGRGATTLTLSPSALAQRGGRMTVIIVLARTGRSRWEATRTGGDPSRQVVAAQAGESQAGAPVASTVVYGRGAPSRLTVDVDDGARWGAVVVFTD